MYLWHFELNFLRSYLFDKSYNNKALLSFIFIFEMKIFIKLFALYLNKIDRISL